MAKQKTRRKSVAGTRETAPPADVTHGKVKKKTGRAAAPGHAERVAARQLTSIQMRRSGATIQQVARATGVSTMQAWRDIKAALTDTLALRDNEAGELRQLELERLDSYLVALAAGIRAGSVPAVREARKVSESRRRLLGLDSPHAIALATTALPELPLADVSTEEIEQRMARAAAVLTAIRAAQPPAPEPEPVPARPTPAELYARELAAKAEMTSRQEVVTQ